MAARIFDKKRGVLQTSGAVTTTLDIAVPNNQSVGFIAKIIAKETTLHIGAMFHQIGSISNNAGTVTLDGTVSSLVSIVNAGLAGTAIAFTANSTNLRMTVTGVILLGIDFEYEIELIYN